MSFLTTDFADYTDFLSPEFGNFVADYTDFRNNPQHGCKISNRPP